MPVRSPVIQAQKKPVGPPCTGQVRQGLVAAGRILHQDHLQRYVPQREMLHPAEAAVGRLQGRDDLPGRIPAGCVGADCRQGIVEVVDGGQADLKLCLLWCSQAAAFQRAGGTGVVL